jgi:hypothetical protein
MTMKGGIGGGGPMPGLLFWDLAQLNTILKAHDYAPLPNSLFMMGGGGGGGLLKGWRFGGGGAGGEASSSLGIKIAKLSVGFGGVLIGYGLSTSDKYDLTVWLLIGGGGAELTLLDHRSDRFEAAISNSPNTVLKRSFFALQPQVTLGLAILKWLSVRLAAGYLLTLGSSWDQAGNELAGPPANFNGWTIQAMFSFGGRSGQS